MHNLGQEKQGKPVSFKTPVTPARLSPCSFPLLPRRGDILRVFRVTGRQFARACGGFAALVPGRADANGYRQVANAKEERIGLKRVQDGQTRRGARRRVLLAQSLPSMAPTGALRHLGLALGAAVAALGSLLFIAWRFYFRDANDSSIGWRGRWEQQLAAELERNRGEGEQAHPCEYQVLVLGLDGAGKSSILHYVASTEVKKYIAPTQGFNSVQLQDNGLQVDLLEVGGSQNLRSYWNHYLSKAHVLVFVVDAADGPRLPAAQQELHCLLAEDARLPLIVLANKQDKSNALSVAELHKELALHTLNNQRKLFLLPTSATYAGLDTVNSVLHLKNLLITLLAQI